LYRKGLRPLSIASAGSLALALGLVFFYAPNDADQGFLQKIFYLHVPLAIVALGGFIAGTCAPTWPSTCRSCWPSAC